MAEAISRLVEELVSWRITLEFSHLLHLADDGLVQTDPFEIGTKAEREHVNERDNVIASAQLILK